MSVERKIERRAKVSVNNGHWSVHTPVTMEDDLKYLDGRQPTILFQKQ